MARLVLLLLIILVVKVNCFIGLNHHKPIVVSRWKSSELPDDQFPEDMFYKDPMNEEESAMIESMREERMLNNDRWQSTSFRDTQRGVWTGNYEAYRPVAYKGPNDLELEMIGGGAIKSTMLASEFKEFGCDITISEDVDVLTGNDPRNLIHPDCLMPSKSSVQSEDWRLCRGNQVVGTAYTTAQTNPSFIKHFRDEDYYPDVIPETYISEIAVREGPARTRVRYVYTKKPTAAITEKEMEQGFFGLHLAGFLIIRELQESGVGADGEGVRGTGGAAQSTPVADTSSADASTNEPEGGWVELLTSPQIGNGIYDPQVTGDPYIQTNYRGRLSLLFPRAMVPQSVARNVLTMEWTARNMRYQVDRKFGEFTGCIKSLELTEIYVDNSEKFPPGFFPPKLE